MQSDHKAIREARLATLSPRARAIYAGRQSLRSQGVDGMRARGCAAAGRPQTDPEIPYHDVLVSGPPVPIPIRATHSRPTASPLPGLERDAIRSPCRW